MRAKLLVIGIFTLLGIMQCGAQDTDASWIHDELWNSSDGGWITGPLYSDKYYFAEDGKFYIGSARNVGQYSGYIQESYSGNYKYDPKKQKVTLYIETDKGDSICDIFIDEIRDYTIKIKFDKATQSSEWRRSRKSGDTFVMASNPVIGRVPVISVCYTSMCYDPNDGSMLEDVEKKEVLNILRNTSYSEDKDFDMEEWITGADFTFYAEISRYGDRVLVCIRKNNPQIYVDARDWMSGASQLYDIEEPCFLRLIEIAEKYKTK